MITNALSFWQPWPYAIFRLGKRLENRGRKDGAVPLNGYTGPILIHAAKRWPKRPEDRLDEVSQIGLHGDVARLAAQEIEGALGTIVGRARITRWVREGSPISFSERDFMRQQKERWWIGPWAAVLADVEEFETPIPYLGSQGIFSVDAETAEACASAAIRGSK